MEDYNDEVAPVGKMESFIINQGPATPELNNKLLISLQKKNRRTR